MRWLELSIESPGEFAEPVTTLFAKHADGRVVVEEAGGYNPDEGEPPPGPDAPVTVRGYIALDGTEADRRARIDLGLRLISYIQPLPPLREREMDELEWRRQTFQPVRVTERIVVAPPDAAIQARAGELVIPLEPGIAFGTGHHPTTRMCLQFLERLITAGARVLDVGCGSGILTIAALLLGASEAVSMDIDGDAIESTEDNLRRAGLTGRARLVRGSLPSSAVPTQAFDLVLANISANVLIELGGALLKRLAPGGVLIGSGFMQERGAEVARALASAGARIRQTRVSGEWAALVASRRDG